MGWIVSIGKYDKIKFNIFNEKYEGSTKSVICRRCGGVGSPLYNIGECPCCKGLGYEIVPVKVFNCKQGR